MTSSINAIQHGGYESDYDARHLVGPGRLAREHRSSARLDGHDFDDPLALLEEPGAASLDFRHDGFLEFPDFCLVSFVKGPLLCALGLNETSRCQDSHVFTKCRL
jgi:hypothetical protein